MLRFHRAAVDCGAPFEGLDYCVADVSDSQVQHRSRLQSHVFTTIDDVDPPRGFAKACASPLPCRRCRQRRQRRRNATQGVAPVTGTADAGRLRGRALVVPTLLLLLGGIAYGGIFSANKLAAGVAFPVFAYTFWIALFAGLALLIVGAVTGKLPPMSRAHLLQYLRLAVLALMLPVLATAFAARELPAGVITLVLTLVPGLTYLMSFAIRMERFEALSLAGLSLGAGGVLLIVLPDQALPEAGAWVWMLVAAGGRDRGCGLQRGRRRLPAAEDGFARARLRQSCSLAPSACCR